MSKYFTITILALLFVLLILPQIGFAAGLVPCGGATEPECNLCHIFQLAQNIIQGASVMIFAFAAVFIVIGGIMILTAAGASERISQGKRMITYSIMGIIVCLGAWLIINTVMNALVDPNKMPWPWNDIKCEPTTGNGGGTHKACVNNACTSVSGAGADVCSADAQCASGDKKYCVCETPVYDLDPNDFPSEASVIGTNAKVTITLPTQAECLTKCVAANASTYCKASLKPQTAIYCANQTDLQNKSACTLNVLTANCQIAATCFNSETECLNAASTTYKKRCYLDGQFLCKCYTGSQKPGICSIATRYVLYRINEERSPGGTSLWNCNNAAPYYCRLNCQYDKCSALPPTNICNQLNPALCTTASCLNGKFTCQHGVIGQISWACTELRAFLTCMGNKSTTDLPNNARVISSIADNSPPVGGSLPGCFRQYTTQCSGQINCTTGANDSCSGTCCGHGKCSLHYGGKAPVSSEGPTDCPGQGSADCRDCSWAVDFANEQYAEKIKAAATSCANQLWSGSLRELYMANEGDHFHVDLRGVAKFHKCR